VAAIVGCDGSVFDFEPPEKEMPWLERAIEIHTECFEAAKAGKLADDEKLCKQCCGLAIAQYYRPEIKAAFGDRPLDPDRHAKILHKVTHEREHTAAFRQERKPLGAIPFWALVAGQHVRKPPLDENNFLLKNFEIAKTSDMGKVILLPDARHMLQATRPDAFVQAVEEAVKWYRETGAKTR
jgi:pimeloyl-ACP methyl ester carboxylesterase